MRDLNFILENAWKYSDDPEKLIWTFQRVFEEYRENPIYLFEYANALDFPWERKVKRFPYINRLYRWEYPEKGKFRLKSN